MKNFKLMFSIAILFQAFLSTTQESNYSQLTAGYADKPEQKVIDWRHDFHQKSALDNRAIIIIPPEVELVGTVRTLGKEDEELAFRRIREVAEKTAEAAGATAFTELPYFTRLPITFNDIELTKNMLPSINKSAGEVNVRLIPAITGSEDFSFFAQKVPVLYFFPGGMPKGKYPK